jgi:ketosteroid isomerase-like protein
MPDVVVTRVQHGGVPRRSRNVEERLMVHFPGVYRALSALGQRLLSPRWRLRQALLRRAYISGWDAASRRDFKLVLVRYAPDVEIEWDPAFEALGLGGTFRGHDGVLKMLQAVAEGWERWELLPDLVLDLGDRALALGTLRLPGTRSGLELESEIAQLMTIRGGLVAREQEFLAWDKGLRAAGLDPDAIALPSRPTAGQAASSAG